jgi:hypothetical protein
MKRTTSVLASGALWAFLSNAAEAGVPQSVSVDVLVGATEGSNSGTTPGTYATSVSPAGSLFATANLVWTATPSNTTYAFSGTASGSDPSSFATSTATVTFSLATASQVWITWDFANVIASIATNGPSAGWAIIDGDASPEQFVYALEYDVNGNPAFSSVGGVPAIGVGSGPTGFLGFLPAGNWIFATNVEVNATVTGGFNVSITLPTPGALPLVAAASLIARRGRRR